MDQIATPALETPVGHIVVLIVGFVFAVGLWSNRESIDLLFFRLSGGSARLGRLAAATAPIVAVAGAFLIASRFL
jgi:hypothetical protein